MATQPSSLDSRTLARRLGELAGDERRVQVEFLLHLDEFDRRRAFLELGHGSLWTFCLEVLHLREGPAGRRIAAMKVLRRFPRLAGALLDGRLCLTTVAQLGPMLTEENVHDLLARAAFRTAAEVDHLVASLRSRQAPREGIRQLPAPATAATAAVPEMPPGPVPQSATLLAMEALGSQERWFFVSNAPRRTPLEELVKAASRRHLIEEAFENSKGEVGLDHHEVRAWRGWHHHMTASLMALWFLARERRRLGGKSTALGGDGALHDLRAAAPAAFAQGDRRALPLSAEAQRGGARQPLARPRPGATAVEARA